MSTARMVVVISLIVELKSECNSGLRVDMDHLNSENSTQAPSPLPWTT
jgi:hypothetical protein